jgi:hypothetical protein
VVVPAAWGGGSGLRRPLLLQAVLDMVAMLIVETESNAAMSEISFRVSLDRHTYLFVCAVYCGCGKSICELVCLRTEWDMNTRRYTNR